MENKISFSNITKYVRKIKIRSLIEKIIPDLEHQTLKGDNGVVGVVGGSFEYTGAPYYSAISALKSGCDLAHVFCHVDAAIPIKSYSPELIVHPGFDDNKDNIDLLNKTARWFKSMDSLVLGPGLGREESTFHNFNYLFNESLSVENLIHIIDADGLWHLMNSDLEKLLTNDSKIILTPNKTEFGRLYKKIFNSDDSYDYIQSLIENKILTFEPDEILILENFKSSQDVDELNKIKEIKLSNSLKNKIILKKGKYDIITNGNSLIIVGNKGSIKRCGGIGDILDGVIATFCSMLKRQKRKKKENISSDELLETCALACYICKEAARRACEKRGYGLTAPDVIEELTLLSVDYNL
jgi:ATP-dependent NAD(P)H-hydrate dehydratase